MKEQKSVIMQESKAVKGVRTIGMTLTGTVVGIVGGIILISIGILLCLTIIGAIIGIPLILVGISMVAVGPFSGAFGGFMFKKANCPYCHNELSFAMTKALNCKYCKKRLLVQGKELVLVQ